MIKRISSLFILALLASCANKSWNFGTDYLKVEVDNKGYIKSMKNTTVFPKKEFCAEDKQSPIMSLYSTEKNEYYYPEKADFNSATNTMTVNYTNGSVAEILIEPQDKYIRMKLVSLNPRNGVDDVQWGSYHTTIDNIFGEIIGVARDTSKVNNYSIGVLALDDNTIGGFASTIGDAAPFQYIIHSPDTSRFPLPDSLHEGQIFTIGGDGISDVAFYSHKEPYFKILYGEAAMIGDDGKIFLTYHSRNRTFEREVKFSLIPNMSAHVPNHLVVEAIPDVDFVGSSVALWGSPDSTALMDVIQNVVISEGLPYPTVNGKWVKDPTSFMPDIANSSHKCDSLVSYTSRLGFKGIHITYAPVKVDRGNEGYLDGKDFSKKPYFFESGNKSHKEVADMASEKGVFLSRANITISVPPGTLDASPVPSDSLCYQQKRKLAQDISATDTLIYIDDPKNMNEIGGWEGHAAHLNMVKIGKELIHYMGVTDTKPYRLKNVKRGYWDTKPTTHSANDDIYKLQVTCGWGYDGLTPNIALLDKFAEYYADICYINGLRMLDFDGQEFLFNNGHGYYSVKRFYKRMFERAKEQGIDCIRFTGATLSEGSWHYQSIWNVGGGRNMYDVNTREWGSATSQGKDLRDVGFANYFPVSFGNNFAITDTSTVEQYEHIQAIAVGFGATYYLSVNQDAIEKCPQKDAIFNAIRTWEDARAAGAFPTHIRELLKDPANSWRLEANGENMWVLHRMIDGKSAHSYSLKGQDVI